jgi:hypothetical protein
MVTSHTIHEMIGHPDGNKSITVNETVHLPVGTICEICHNLDGSEIYHFSVPGSPGHDDGHCCHDRHRYLMEADDKFHYLPTI